MVTIDTLTHMECAQTADQVPWAASKSWCSFTDSRKCALETNDAQGESVKHISINAGLNLLMSSYNVRAASLVQIERFGPQEALSRFLYLINV